ncbi:FKBP-type peptidyl-prolyl cis-trans isomerase [Chitinophaga barathri]|uniref:Peptidyl-prolyl cis-trans isomerase n=1 Tax=Chitinophaga barathri TaxID=1647451 RepID=A0A3N4MNE6_9BACT|nr:FKBP-type peptidyl-prolyl cis-trans isomerase [Chitinophaga barathri]RPD41580.1 peptidylprolyl isomerase [Chitinophaga barathri]
MKRNILGLVSLLAVVLIFACNKKDDDQPPYDYDKQAAIDEQSIKDYIAANNLTGYVRDTTGVYFKVLTNGQGGDTIKLTDRFNIDYKGFLLNGTRFDSAVGQTFGDMRLGQPGLIAGFKVGPMKTTKGGTVRYFIPSVLGYQYQDKGTIPPNSVLIFEVKLNNYYY